MLGVERSSGSVPHRVQQPISRHQLRREACRAIPENRTAPVLLLFSCKTKPPRLPALASASCAGKTPQIPQPQAPTIQDSRPPRLFPCCRRLAKNIVLVLLNAVSLDADIRCSSHRDFALPRLLRNLVWKILSLGGLASLDVSVPRFCCYRPRL